MKVAVQGARIRLGRGEKGEQARRYRHAGKLGQQILRVKQGLQILQYSPETAVIGQKKVLICR